MPPLRSTSEIRELYLRFFESKEHLRYPSHPIPVYDDPTLMFSVAGMTQFKPYFVGSVPKFPGIEGIWRRVTTAQKCIRIGDIENVGRTNRHCSFFEMLGNFSFDSYFKREAITWAWEFLTNPAWLGLEPDRLYVTIYIDDDEAFEIWTKEVGLTPSRIHRFGEDENFWPQNAPTAGPNGPCGPCSEIYYDRGETFGSDSWEDYAQTRESTRFLEIWNLVFPGYNRTEGLSGEGVLEELGRKNIDTGMGLVRVAAISQDVEDFYATDDFLPLIQAISAATGVGYAGPASVSHRVIAEHIRMCAMTLADGVNFDNTGRGYVVRKVLRRAVRHGYLLGLREPLLYTLVPLVAQTLGQAYPEMPAAQEAVMSAIKAEETRFLATLGAGIGRLEGLFEQLSPGEMLSGHDAFTLYDTYGFPIDLTEEIASERGHPLDRTGFNVALEAQQERARRGSKFSGGHGLFGTTASVLEGLSNEHGETQFVGYDERQAGTTVLALISSDEGVERAKEGDEVRVILQKTPMYAEGGGQVGDMGVIEWPEGRAQVTNTQKTSNGLFLHEARILRGVLKAGETVEARVDPARSAVERHHTATHLLHAALRAVLGTHVVQRGSLVAATRLRFDFSHPQPVSDEELTLIELLVNRFIQADFPVTWHTMPLADARRLGAMALFGEKYGELVRVVSVDGTISAQGMMPGSTSVSSNAVSSKELCGGTHVRRTGEIGSFVIRSEEGTAAGIRRIEALCGEEAVHFVREALDGQARAARLVGATPEELEGRILRLQDDLKAREKELGSLKNQLVRAQTASSSGSEAREIAGFRVASLELGPGLSSDALRNAADDLMNQAKADIVVIGAVDPERGGGLVVKASREAVARGAHAGTIVGKLAQAGGGRGGGRPDLAQAGVSDLKAALAAIEQTIEQALENASR